MKLYRYRPITQTLFKELMYQEIYLASYVELNDPLDMATLLDFHSDERAEVRYLAQFLLGRIFRSTQSMAALRSLRDGAMFENFVNKLLRHMNQKANSKTPLSTKGIFRLLRRLHNDQPDDFDFLRNLDLVQDDVGATVATFFNNSFVACFSEENEDFLMWSHYADKHQGICLEFEVIDRADGECLFPFEILGQPKVDSDGNQRIGFNGYRYHEKIRRVEYVDTVSPTSFYDFLPVFESEGDVDLHCLSKSRWHPFADKISGTYLQKLKRWQSEKEWRIVDVNFEVSEGPEERIQRYSMSALTGIIFGHRTRPDVKRRIYNIMRHKSKTVEFLDAVIDEDGSFYIAPADEDQFLLLT